MQVICFQCLGDRLCLNAESRRHTGAHWCSQRRKYTTHIHVHKMDFPKACSRTFNSDTSTVLVCTHPAAANSSDFPPLFLLMYSLQLRTCYHRLKGSILDQRWKVNFKIFSLKMTLRVLLNLWSVACISGPNSVFENICEPVFGSIFALQWQSSPILNTLNFSAAMQFSRRLSFFMPPTARKNQ